MIIGGQTLLTERLSLNKGWLFYSGDISSSYMDITPFIKYGDEINTIAVRVDAEAQEGWWYEGVGIYRNTWLVKRNPLHIITDGVYANPILNLWSVDNPYLYIVKTELKQNGKLVDEVTTKCGFRTIRFDKDSGFYIGTGQRIRLKKKILK